MEAKYNHKNIESKWYEYWVKNHLFHSEPDNRPAYTVVIPPPNVTGVLHMGHVLNNTIQDILVRHARLQGKNACWVPGTDHASIATEAKVIKKLKEQGINKADLSREEFLKHAWAWTDEYGGIILKQLRTLGCSCDWDRTAFTMDEKRSKAVIDVFCDLYDKGLIYRGLRMVNWDPERQTALSDEEVIYQSEHSHLYYLKYRVVGEVDVIPEGSEVHKDEKGYYALIATTRPETIMGDVAVCINPKDPKNAWLRGKKLIVPLVNREVPVIEDRYVEIGFGTGCLKVTPAHDANDYVLGQKYNLETIDIFTPDAHIAPVAGLYVGMDRFECKKQIEKDLQKQGLLEKVENYENNVGYSERTNVPIEPRLSLQWFIKMQHFADLALPPVMKDEIVFYPTKYKNTYKHWLENIKDWCISRQLWWGHRIPAYYLPNQDDVKDEDRQFVVAPTREEALQKAQKINPNIKLEDLTQDEGALDTWFSSWLWPISLFDGIDNPKNKELQYYYPTTDLVTAPDIIFFWVARMIMAGYEYMHDKPFQHVYFTGVVRDKLGRKMSKSLGNSPDPLDLIDKYGADGVRMGMMLCAPAGNDILFDDSLCEQGRNFCNKIWNCYRLIDGWKVAEKAQLSLNTLAIRCFDNLLTKKCHEIEDMFAKYRLSEALMAIYLLFCDEFSGWLLEMIKPAYEQPIDAKTYEHVKQIFEKMLQLLHPFMPFITEELWQTMQPRKESQSIMYATLQIADKTSVEANLLQQMEYIKSVVSGVRNIRASKNIPNKEAVELLVGTENINQLFAIDSQASWEIIQKLSNVVTVQSAPSKKPEGVTSFLVDTTEFSIPLAQFVNKDEEREKLQADLAYQQKFLQSVKAKLSNERFVQNAKPEIVALERKKQTDAEQRIATLEEALKNL